VKPIYSLFFLLLILLNTFGYYEVLVTIEKQNHHQAVAKIDENQNEISGNLLLKIPVSLPYSHNDSEYKRVYGEIIVEGQVYHYVKQKLYNDTLYVVCLKDVKSTAVRNAIADYSSKFSDQAKSERTHKGQITTLAKVYTLFEKTSLLNSAGWVIRFAHIPFKNLYSFSSIASIFHPPS
jgi:hypothetical protein